MKFSLFPIVLLLCAQYPVFGSEWGRHEGGSGVNPHTLVGQEKGDALYRKLEIYSTIADYHAAIFMGVEFGEFGGILNTPSLRIVEKVGGDADQSRETTINGIEFVAHGVITGQGGGSYSQHGMGEMTIYPKNGQFTHTVANMNALSEACRWGWGKIYTTDGYGGAFSTTDESANDHNGPWKSNIDASRRTQIVSESQRIWDYGSEQHALGYCMTDMVELKFQPEQYFQDLDDVENCRCDFIPEWSYEEKLVLAWHGEESAEKTGSGDKYIGDGRVDCASFHNNMQGSNDCYTPSELSPQVQSGDFWSENDDAFCWYDPHDARGHTKMRPSEVEKPVIEFFGRDGDHLRIQISDNASEYIYFSILVYQNGNSSPPGIFQAYARDESGQEYKYQQLFLSQSFVVNGKTHRRQSYSFHINDSLFSQKDRAVLVITDEGCNSSEATFGGPIGDEYNPYSIGLLIKYNGVTKAHLDPYGNLMALNAIDYPTGGLMVRHNGYTKFNITTDGSVGLIYDDGYLHVYNSESSPASSMVIRNENGAKRLAVTSDYQTFITGGLWDHFDLSGF